MYRVPPIGQHFAIRWAKEDMEAERTKGAEDKDAREDGGKLIKKADVKSDGSPFGELTQVSTLQSGAFQGYKVFWHDWTVQIWEIHRLLCVNVMF